MGNGCQGSKQPSPFNAILTTAATPKIPVPLIGQLEIGGKIVLPLSDILPLPKLNCFKQKTIWADGKRIYCCCGVDTHDRGGAKMKRRSPAVAGRFYPANPSDLEKEIKSHLTAPSNKKQKAMGVVSPHAGFMYSGDVAGAVYSRIEIPDTAILMSPNHTRSGYPVSIMMEGSWGHAYGRCNHQ